MKFEYWSNVTNKRLLIYPRTKCQPKFMLASLYSLFFLFCFCFVPCLISRSYSWRKVILLSKVVIVFYTRLYTGIDRKIVKTNEAFLMFLAHTAQTQEMFRSSLISHFTFSLFCWRILNSFSTSITVKIHLSFQTIFRTYTISTTRILISMCNVSICQKMTSITLWAWFDYGTCINKPKSPTRIRRIECTQLPAILTLDGIFK